MVTGVMSQLVNQTDAPAAVDLSHCGAAWGVRSGGDGSMVRLMPGSWKGRLGCM